MSESGLPAPAGAQRQSLTPTTLIVAGNGLSIAGSALNLIALLTLLYGGSHGALSVGGAVLISFVPVAIVLPIVGRRLAPASPRRALVGVSLMQAALAIVMAMDATSSHGHLALLYPATALLGLAAIVTRTVTYTVLPRLVVAGGISRVNLSLQVSSQIGAMVGGALVVVVGNRLPAWALFVGDAATFAAQGWLFALALKAELPPSPAEPPPAAAGEHAPRRAFRGIRGPAGAGFFYAVVPAGFIALNAVNVALPLQTLGHLNAGRRGFAAAEMVYPIAAIASGLIARRRTPPALASCIAIVTLGMVLLAWSPSLPVLLLAVLVIGAGNVLTNAVGQILLQSRFQGGELGRIQGRCAGVGATVSTPVVLAIAWAFDRDRGTAVMLVVAGLFAVLVGIAVVGARRDGQRGVGYAAR